MVLSGSNSTNNDALPVDSLTLREIQPGDICAGLSLGHANYVPLKTFLRRDANRYHQQNVAKTYVMVDASNPPIVWAYISLMCSVIALTDLSDEHLPEDIDEYRYPDFPAIKIARLAVDRRMRRKDIGRTLIQFAMSVAKDRIMPAIGCRFLVVDSKQESIDFYLQCGFTLLKTEKNLVSDHPLLYVDLHYI